MEEFEKKAATLKEMICGGGKKVVVLSHTNPDGDAIGSTLTWAHVLEENGNEVTCILPNRYPSFLEWMTGIERFVIAKENPDKALEAIGGAELIFCLDLNLIERLDNLLSAIEANSEAKRILIDHHLNPPTYYDLMFSYPQDCATSFVVYRLIEEMFGVEALDRTDAENLYTGIMTDTGNLSFSFLTPRLFCAIAELLKLGLDIPRVNTAVYNAFSEGRMRLLGYALYRKMTLIEDSRVAYIDLSEREMRRFNFQLGDSEGFVNFPLSIAGVKMSALFMQTHKFIRVSLRSRGDEVDVNVFARRYFGGGGHKNAAGGKSFVSMGETVEYFKKSVAEFLAEGAH